MIWLSKPADTWSEKQANRFDARFWTLDFPRPMMGSVVTVAPDALSVTLVFYKADDLAGLIWSSADTDNHPLLGYRTDRDYRGVELSFRWQSNGVKALDAVHGPTLTIEGRDAAGNPRSWFVRLWNYASGTPEDAVITLDFDDLEGGFLLPGEADPVWAGDIDRMFISMVPVEFDGIDSAPLLDAGANPALREAGVTISDIRAGGGRVDLGFGDDYIRPHDVNLANGYDDVFNVTPERIIRNWLQLGYRGWINHYAGMSHYFSLRWQAGESRFVVDSGLAKLNAAARAWHQDFFERAAGFGLRVIVSLSFELFYDNAPEAWAQRTHDGSPALTGWMPPSTLLSPANAEAMDYLRDVFLDFAALMTAAGLEPVLQIGEPWWWVQLDQQRTPCFYDDAALTAYTAETGLPVPTRHQSAAETADAEQTGYLDWLGQTLGAATLRLRDQIRAGAAGARVYLLFFTPQVFDAGAPMLKRVNFPTAAWAFPAFDIFQIEAYDHVIAGDWRAHAADLDTVAAELGYGAADSHYLSGFVLDAADEQIWPRIDEAIERARERGFAEVFIWAYPQVVRDGMVYVSEESDAVQGFHDVRLADRIAFGSTGGPRFSTDVIETASGHERRNINWAEARMEFEISGGIQTDDDLADLLAFFRARRGRAFAFRFRDWADFRSCAPSATPAATDQVIGTGDGITTSFDLIKTYDSGSESLSRPITLPVPGSVSIALDGAGQDTGWQLDAQQGRIDFDTPPADGSTITAGFEFDIAVRFAEDVLAVSLEGFRAGSVTSIRLVEVRRSSP